MSSAPPSHNPKSIRKGDEFHLLITWDDGHESSYNTAGLRRACPCAGCVNEWTGEPILDPFSVLDTVKPIRIEPVGRYAIRIVWDDGHDTGIYTFASLRTLCSCKDCTPQEK